MENQKGLISQQEISNRFAYLADEIRKEGEHARVQILKRRFILKATFEEFINLFTASATYILQTKGHSQTFQLNSRNDAVLYQIYLYLSHNDQFEGSFNKGLMLQGRCGSGKTIIMESYAHLQNYLIKRFERYDTPMITYISSYELNRILEKDGEAAKRYSRRELVIDDFGRESKSVMNYGNISRPLSELISLRAENASITHGTTNFSLDTFASNDFYGPMIADRLRAMFNFILLDGVSLRV